MKKRLVSLLLVLCMAVSCVTVGVVTASAANVIISDIGAALELASTAADYGLAKTCEDGNILHCFNWTLNDIKNELPNIAAAGFSSVQTSPLQPHNASGAWYWLYQPTDSTIGNELGDYNALKSLCSEADKYGIKVIVDVVANHLAGWNDGRWSDSIAGSWKNGSYFHNEGACNNWDNRYDVTHKNIGMPDLNSENTEVINKWVSLVQGLKSAGVDGVRWDAAKHIGLPSEGCQFWASISAQGMYNYGEILDNPAGSSGDDYNNSLMKEYGSYIGVTDSSFSGHITGCIRDGKADGSWNGKWTNAGVSAKRVVYWAESHDTYCNNGWTNSLDERIIDRAYAVLAARADSQALYLSRPFEKNHNSIMYGRKGSTHYTSKEVAAVNHFHNAMIGTKEYFTADNGCFVVCRGGGAVIVSPSGSDFDITVQNGGGLVPSGTYTDEVSGSTWTVSGSSISGHIGNTGVAVIYNQPAAGPTVYATPGSSTFKTDTISVTLGYSNATSGTYSVNGSSFQNFSNGQSITIGSGVSAGAKITLTVRATNGSQTDQATYTYTKVDPNATQTVYFNNNYYMWKQVYCYIYVDNSGNIISNGVWPGQRMTEGTGGVWFYDIPTGLENGRAIFTENSGNNDHRYPGDGDPGLDLNYNSMIFGDNRSWTVYDGPALQPQQPTQQTPTQGQPTQPPVTPDGKILMGDSDQDNVVTVFDATMIQRHIAGMSTLTGNAWYAADVDSDQYLTIFDATAIQRYISGYKVNAKVNVYADGTSPVDPQDPTSQIITPPSGGVILNATATREGNEAWYAWTWGSGEGRWVKGEGSGAVVTFSGLDSSVIFARVDPTMDVDWNNGSVWNQTDDLSTQANGTFTTTGWNANRMIGSWS